MRRLVRCASVGRWRVGRGQRGLPICSTATVRLMLRVTATKRQFIFVFGMYTIYMNYVYYIHINV
jgi:hypothetical protein